MQMNDPTPIVLEGVTFAYPTTTGSANPAVVDVDLRVEPTDFVGIIGPNGGGKTTLLMLMLGLLKPQRGRIAVFGGSPTGAPAGARAQIGYVSQRATLDLTTPATVLEVVLTGRLRHAGWGFRYGGADVDAAIAALRLTETNTLTSRPIAALSGGQRQRVLIARALAADAQLLLLDEPMSGVDEPMQQGLTELLHRLNQRIPIVVVSHDVGFVSQHVKHVVCVNRRVTQHRTEHVTEETIAEMYHGPTRAVRHDEDCPSGSHPSRAAGDDAPGASA